MPWMSAVQFTPALAGGEPPTPRAKPTAYRATTMALATQTPRQPKDSSNPDVTNTMTPIPTGMEMPQMPIAAR